MQKVRHSGQKSSQMYRNIPCNSILKFSAFPNSDIFLEVNSNKTKLMETRNGTGLMQKAQSITQRQTNTFLDLKFAPP